MTATAPSLVIDVMARSIMRIVSENPGSTFVEIRSKMPASPEVLLRRRCIDLAECGYLRGHRIGAKPIQYFASIEGLTQLKAADDAAIEASRESRPEAVIVWLAAAILFLASAVFLYLKFAR